MRNYVKISDLDLQFRQINQKLVAAALVNICAELMQVLGNKLCVVAFFIIAVRAA